MDFYTVSDIACALKRKDISSVEITEYFLQRIAKLNPKINCFITVTPEQALRQARAADARRARGVPLSDLDGVPLTHKDNFCTVGVKTTCASKMLSNFEPLYNATVVNRFEEKGLVMLGKANMDEFAMGSSNETSFYGSVKNPWDLERVPGGSSGGSSAAVSARLTPFATGSDTGGSIRQPASLCNLVGIKPTYGRVSRYGMVAFASSLDQAGPLTHTAEDAAHIMNIMAGVDSLDSTSIADPVPDYTQTLNNSLQGLTLGIPEEYFDANLNPQVVKLMEDAIDVYKQLGMRIKKINLKSTHQGIPLYYLIASAESASNLARYDGVHYGYRCDSPKNLQDLYVRSRSEAFGEEVKRRILIGTHILSASAYNAYYIKAQTMRKLLMQEFLNTFQEVDLILGPTTPSPAFKFQEKTDDPLQMYLSDIYTVTINLAGLPAISVPAGFVNDLPVGMQLVGPRWSEARLLNVAHTYQKKTNWHLHSPRGLEHV